MQTNNTMSLAVMRVLFLFSFQNIVKNYLGKYNKKLDDQQMNWVLTKKSAVNPLWLTVACEELRVHGNFRTIGNKINQLADDLNG